VIDLRGNTGGDTESAFNILDYLINSSYLGTWDALDDMDYDYYSDGNQIEFNHIYVLVGDGECDEGLVWESLMSASHFNLTNLTVIVDFNSLQSDGFTEEIMNKSTLGEKFKAFGFNVKEIDGHNLNSLTEAFESRDYSKPNAIIAHTIKGKGVSFMEHNVNWHHGSLSSEQYELAVSEQKQ